MIHRFVISAIAVSLVAAVALGGPAAGTRTQLRDVTWTDAGSNNDFRYVASKYHVVFGTLKHEAPIEIMLKLEHNLITPKRHTNTSAVYGTVLHGTLKESDDAAGSAELAPGATWYEPAKVPYGMSCASSSTDDCIVVVYFPNGYDYATVNPNVKDIVQPVYIDPHAVDSDSKP